MLARVVAFLLQDWVRDLFQVKMLVLSLKEVIRATVKRNKTANQPRMHAQSTGQSPDMGPATTWSSGLEHTSVGRSDSTLA